MQYQELKKRVCKANLALVEAGLVVLTWGNASAADRHAPGHSAGVMAIKPSGVPYSDLCEDNIVVLDIASGAIVDGKGRPSSDTPTHLHLYRSFAGCNGIVHTHSTHATAFAQAMADIPCIGTTHADNFYGNIPCTRPLEDAEVQSEYELNTGKVIVDCFTSRGINPAQVPGVVVAAHAPFAWGETIEKAVENAIVLEFTAKMAILARSINSDIPALPRAILDKHYLRKHGPTAYYGQANK
jgi:L-ribulose-5-phosphate 4-epimerase